MSVWEWHDECKDCARNGVCKQNRKTKANDERFVANTQKLTNSAKGRVCKARTEGVGGSQRDRQNDKEKGNDTWLHIERIKRWRPKGRLEIRSYFPCSWSVLLSPPE